MKVHLVAQMDRDRSGRSCKAEGRAPRITASGKTVREGRKK